MSMGTFGVLTVRENKFKVTKLHGTSVSLTCSYTAGPFMFSNVGR